MNSLTKKENRKCADNLLWFELLSFWHWKSYCFYSGILDL